MQSLKFLPWCETAEDGLLLALLQNLMNFVHHEFGSLVQFLFTFSICPYLPSNLLAKPCFCFPAGLSLTLSLSSNLSGSYQNTALIISPYSLCKLFADAKSSSSLECAGALTLPGKIFPGALWPSRLNGPTTS